jgi:hypothetical protein
MTKKQPVAVLFILGSAVMSLPVHARSGDLHEWFQTRTQALFEAIAVGDRQIWDQTLDETCVITTEDGEVQDKHKFLTDLRPLPKGFIGSGTIRGLTVQDLGAVAVVHYWIDESENIFGQELRTSYIETDTYHRQAGTWKIVAMQITVVPRDLEPITTEAAGSPALVGDYRFPGDEQIRYRVFIRNGVLFGGRDEKSATMLIPLAPLVFFQQGSIHLIIFVRDHAGFVAEVREIHKYNEVRMERVSAAPSP